MSDLDVAIFKKHPPKEKGGGELDTRRFKERFGLFNFADIEARFGNRFQQVDMDVKDEILSAPPPVMLGVTEEVIKVPTLPTIPPEFDLEPPKAALSFMDAQEITRELVKSYPSDKEITELGPWDIPTVPHFHELCGTVGNLIRMDPIPSTITESKSVPWRKATAAGVNAGVEIELAKQGTRKRDFLGITLAPSDFPRLSRLVTLVGSPEDTITLCATNRAHQMELETAISHMMPGARPHFIEYPYGGVPSTNQKYDVVVSFRGIDKRTHNVFQMREFADQMAGLLKPDGIAVLAVPSKTGLEMLSQETVDVQLLPSAPPQTQRNPDDFSFAQWGMISADLCGITTIEDYIIPIDRLVAMLRSVNLSADHFHARNLVSKCGGPSSRKFSPTDQKFFKLFDVVIVHNPPLGVIKQYTSELATSLPPAALASGFVKSSYVETRSAGTKGTHITDYELQHLRYGSRVYVSEKIDGTLVRCHLTMGEFKYVTVPGDMYGARVAYTGPPLSFFAEMVPSATGSVCFFYLETLPQSLAANFIHPDSTPWITRYRHGLDIIVSARGRNEIPFVGIKPWYRASHPAIQVLMDRAEGIVIQQFDAPPGFGAHFWKKKPTVDIQVNITELSDGELSVFPLVLGLDASILGAGSHIVEVSISPEGYAFHRIRKDKITPDKIDKEEALTSHVPSREDIIEALLFSDLKTVPLRIHQEHYLYRLAKTRLSGSVDIPLPSVDDTLAFCSTFPRVIDTGDPDINAWLHDFRRGTQLSLSHGYYDDFLTLNPEIHPSTEFMF